MKDRIDRSDLDQDLKDRVWEDYVADKQARAQHRQERRETANHVGLVSLERFRKILEDLLEDVRAAQREQEVVSREELDAIPTVKELDEEEKLEDGS